MKKSFYLGLILLSICSCKSNAFDFKTKNVNIHFETVVGWDEKSKIKGKTGEFLLLNSGKTPFIYTEDGRPCVNVKLKNEEEEQDVILLIDTGTPGNVITKKIREKINGKRSDYKFLVSAVNQYNLEPVSYGYYFDSIESDGFSVSNILMQEFNEESFGYTQDGKSIDGILGIDFLMHSNVLISYSENQLCFFSEKEKLQGEAIKIKESFLKKHRINTSFYIGKKKYEGFIDTGASSSYINGKALKNLLNNVSFIIDERYEKEYSRHCLMESVDFLSETFDVVPVWSARETIFDKTITIGNYILRKYDIYIDWDKKEVIYLKNTNPVLDINFDIYISDNPNGVFGICLSTKGEKELVASKFYLNGEPLINDIDIGDEIISINHINVCDFDWNKWPELTEADFEILHNGRVISKRLERQHITYNQF